MSRNQEIVATSRRDEIEQALEERQQRISERVDALQAFVPSGTGVVKSAIRRVGGRRILPVVAAAGVFLLVRGLRSRRWTPYDEGLEQVSKQLAENITEQIQRGESPSDAVRSALDTHPPILELKQSRGLLGIISHHFSRSFSSAISKEIVDRIIEIVDRKWLGR